ncbi:hypothetical protein N7454_000877 [Penicillium verhagenii]|nr:hypothetical protein N7454_000877 [Penicillium verhagenii]
MQLYNVFAYPIVRDQLIANTVLVAVATLTLVLRFVSRHLRRSNIWWDDAFCVGSMLHTYVLIAKMLIVYQIVYYNAMVLAKFSYLFFYLRIFVTREFRILTIGGAGVGGHCASQNVAFSTIGAFNLITDVLIMALPVRFIWKLQMSVGTKMALYGIFGLGIFISSITIIRIRVLTTVDFDDLPYSMIWAAFWSVTEPALAIANSCAPMLRPIVKAAFPSLFGSAKAGYSTQPASNGPKPILSKNNTFDRIVDIEYPLTQMDERSASGDEGSLNDRSHDDRSHDEPYHFPRSVVGDRP